MIIPKVFGIGFHKTGTTSLGHALQLLGYRVCGGIGVHEPDIAVEALDLALQVAPRFDAFQDNPWPVLYRNMDCAFPGSRFILTERDIDSWWLSVSRHFGTHHTPMREWIYGAGCPVGNESLYRERHQRHCTEVKAYFKDRPGDLCVMNFSKGDGWEMLCEFLGCPVPDRNFPHLNKAARE